MDDKSIAKSVRECLALFQKLASLPSSPFDTSHQTALTAIIEEEARFKIWSGNIGAHSLGRQSLQYRLRDASHLQKQVLALLADLSELLEDAFAIVSGSKVPWDQIEDDEVLADESDSLQDPDSDKNEFPATELEQISTNVPDTVNCLLRLSVAIRNPAPHDRFAASVPVDVSYYEPFDIHHVQAKFQKIDNLMAQRLGHAISRRRQYFKYRESHRLKLAHGLDLTNEADGKSTVASSIPGRAKGGGFNMESSAIDEDVISNSGISQTSFASSLADIERLRIPPPPKGAGSGPFECPFCYMIITATNRISWKRHVFADLRPYICLSEDCTTTEKWFGRRHEWMLHEVENHWKFYSCPYLCSEPFQSRSKCLEHIHKSHPSATPRYQLEAMINLNSRPIRTRDGITCPICKESLDSVKEYQRHVGRHQEQLAIFALPPSQSQENEDVFGDDESNSGRSDVDSESIDTTDGGVRLGELQIDDHRELVSVPFFSTVEKIEPVDPEAQPSAPASVTAAVNNASDGVFQEAIDDLIRDDGGIRSESTFRFPRRPVFTDEPPHIDRFDRFDRFERPGSQTKEVESTPSNRAPDHNLDSFTTSHNDHERSNDNCGTNTYDEKAIRHRHLSLLRLAEIQRQEDEERQRDILRIAKANAKLSGDNITSRSSPSLTVDDENAIRRLHEEEEERRRRVRLRRIAKANAESNASSPVPSPPPSLSALSFKTTAAALPDDNITSKGSLSWTADDEDAIRRLHEEEEERRRRVRLHRIAKAEAEIYQRPPMPMPPAPIPLTAEALRRVPKNGEWPRGRAKQGSIADSDRATYGGAFGESDGKLKTSGDNFAIRLSEQAVVRVPGVKIEEDGSSVVFGGQPHVPTHEDNERTIIIDGRIYAPVHAPYECETLEPVTYEHALYDPELAASHYY